MEGVKKDYYIDTLKVQALRGINLNVDRGEFVSIIGPSGSGKSTLMNILGCLDAPDAGCYFLNGVNVTELNDNALTHTRNHTLGFIFQNFNLLPRTSALNNVETPLIYAGVKKKERHRKAKNMLERVGLADRLHHTTNQLSGGQQQRVAIARALVNQPALLLADEPTGNLDSASSNNIMSLLEEINNHDGVTILLITHEPEIARRTQRRLSLRDGQLANYS
jgi:putative ABC transport system ATP-binding protein